MSIRGLAEMEKGCGCRRRAIMRGRFPMAAILVCLLLLGVSRARAQNSADVYGIVTDPSGAAVPGAKVTVTNVGTNASRSITTGPDGDYSFPLLPVGTYSVTVEAKGFKLFRAANITLAAEDHARVNAQLQVGAVTQSVVISGSAAPVLQTSSATVSTLITPTAVQNLPLDNRQIMRLVQLSAGAAPGAQSSVNNGTRPDDRRLATGLTVNAVSETENNFILDGVDDNERSIGDIVVVPSIDSLEEVRVITNNYQANVGRAGGGVVEMTTKSGTNQFHGDAFEFNRNAALAAKNYFNTGAKPPFQQNDFGGSLGGPIVRNKSFFFGDYENLRINQGVTQTSFIPTPCELGRATCNGVEQLGNFSDISTPIFNPATNTQYDYNGVPNLMPPVGSGNPGAINSVSADYAALYPTVSGCATGPCPFVYSPSQTQNFITADGRFDYHFRTNQTYFARYTINNGDSTFPGGYPGVKLPGLSYTVYGNGAVPISGTFPGSNYGRFQNITMGWDDILRPNLLVDVRAAFSRFVSISTANNAGHNVNEDIGGPANTDIPSLGISGLALFAYQDGGYSSLGDQFALPIGYWEPLFQYAANFSWTHGPHTVKFGASVIRRDWSTELQLFKGLFDFSSSGTNGGIRGDGNSFASLLVGNASTVRQVLAFVTPSDRNWEVGEYVQDTWQATRRVTLDLGVRYDIFTPFTEKHNAISNFDPTNLSVLESGRVQVAGQLGVPANLGIATQYNMLQPRLGFAAVIGPNLVLRGGFGTSYFVSNTHSPADESNAPWGYAFFASNRSISQPLPPPTLNPALECLVPACGATGTNTVGDAITTNFRNGMVYMFNLTMEKSFGPNDISVGWVGQPGRHISRTIPNADVPGAPGVTGCTNVSEPGPCQPFYQYLPLTSSIQLFASDGASSYNALNAVFTRRAARGLNVQAHYTYQAALADAGSTGGACTTCGIEPFNPRSDWGFSDLDVRNSAAIAVDYQIPFGQSLTGFAGGALKGWEVNGIFAFSSGLPFTVTDATHQSGVVLGGGGPDRPNVVAYRYTSHAPVSLHGSPAIQWIDPTDISLQQPGFNGNEERNQFWSPSEKKLDFSVFKDFQIRESRTLQLRAEFFNLTNTPSLTTPNNTVSAYSGGPGSPATTAGNFSYVTSTNTYYTPREIQLAVRFIF